MTRAGYAVLESELKHRVQTERARLVEEIQEAIADDTNLAENTEYQAAKALANAVRLRNAAGVGTAG
jgi:transcription elongation factor GreA